MRRVLPVGPLLMALMLACLPATPGRAQSPPPELRLFAASSLTDVLGELSRNWQRAGGTPVKLSFAASSVLARQMEAGDAADVFVSADRAWMDYLAERQRIDTRSRRNLAGNRLVIIGATDNALRLMLRPGPDFAQALRQALGDGRLSTADPDTVPAGRYAREALTWLGAWEAVADRLARAENVRVALMYVARGEAPLGIVYATDAGQDSRVRIIATFPEDSHPPITYPAALRAGAGRDARALLDYLSSAEAAPVWRKYGFVESKR